MKGWPRRISLAALLLVTALFAYRFGGNLLSGGWSFGQEEELEVSSEIADEVLARINSLRSSEEGGSIRVGAGELTSLIRYRLPDFVPDGAKTPTIRLRDGRVHLSATVSTQAFPEVPPLGAVLGAIPDTVEVQLRGTLVPFDNGSAALHVDRAQTSLVPLPARFLPAILSGLGRRDGGGLPEHAISVPLPHGVTSVYVLEDSLVITADR